MEKLLFIKIETPERYQVVGIHFIPQELSEEQKEDGVLITIDIPEPEIRPFKADKLYFNPVTNILWYEYVDRPLTREEEFIQLNADNVILKSSLEATNSMVDFLAMSLM